MTYTYSPRRSKPPVRHGKLSLGRRKVSRQNHSYITTIPRVFVDSYLDSRMEVDLTIANGRLVMSPVLWFPKIEGEDKS